MSRRSQSGQSGQSGMTLLEVIIATGVVAIGLLMVGATLFFFQKRSAIQMEGVDQHTQAQLFVQVLKKDLATASDISGLPSGATGFSLKQKIFSAGTVVTRDISYVSGATTTCKTSKGTTYSCIKVQRTVGTGAGAVTSELPGVVAFRWCSIKLNNPGCTSAELQAIGVPSAGNPVNSRFIGQLEVAGATGESNRKVNFVFEAANVGATIHALKTE